MFLEILIMTPHNSPKAKSQLLKECRKLCRYNTQQLCEIKRFEETYRSQDAIQWYTKPCFLFRIVNNVLRSQNPYYLYMFRYYIFDLSASLKCARPSAGDRLRLYRGAKIFRDEVEKLNVDSLVAVNGFFSTSLNRRVAEAFIRVCPISGKSASLGRNENIQFVIYEIDIDFQGSLDLVVAHACTQSYVRDEEEMIFDLGTTFVITHICYDEEHFFWKIQMTYSSEVALLAQEYNSYIHERLKEFNAEILFGRILSTNLAEYSYALTIFHELLRTLPVGCEERPKVYFELGRLYRFQGNHQKAIQYFQAARLLQRRYLPQWKFDYGATLAGLSTVYLELGDATAALVILEQSKICFKDYPFDHNYETIFQANLFSYAYYLDHQYERALDLLNVALVTYKIKMPLDHPSHAQAWHNMGLVQRALGHYQESLAAFKEALRMRISRLAPDHPYIARTLYQMSLLYEQLDDVQLAFDCITKALSIQKLKLTQTHDELKGSIILYERLASKQSSSIMS